MPPTVRDGRLCGTLAYADLGYVACNEAGEPYHPSTLSRLRQAAISDLDVPQVRLHDARHTCATLMHLQGVPIALVAACWAMLTSHSHFAPTYALSPRL
jgi:integrase